MSTGRQIRIALALLALGASGSVCAQQFTGLLANACQTVDAQGRVVLALGAPVSAGGTVVVGVAADRADASGITVTDPAASSYRPLGGLKNRSDDSTVTLLAAQTGTALAAGSLLTVRAELAAADTQLCVVAAAFDGLFVSPLAQRGQGTAAGNGSNLAISVAHPTDLRRRLLVGAFAGDAAYGTISPAGGILATPPICASDGAPCITLLHAAGATALPEGTDLVAGTANTVGWRATGAVIAAVVIHADGFE